MWVGRRERRASLVLGVFLFVFGVLSSFGNGDSNDGKTLLEIKKSFHHADIVLPDWSDVSHYCSWRGVTCENITFDAVLALNLSGLNIIGEISPAIGNLKHIVSIDVSQNRLFGQIPNAIGHCSSLQYLDLSFNNIYGDIPYSISKLNELNHLILKANQLVGPIPSALSQISNLKILDLAQNNLSGKIPSLIYWNEALSYIGLRGNNLEGTLSQDMCQLTSVWFFDVKNNSLTGNIPENIGNCTSFQVLDLSYNHLTGRIPYNIGFLQVATLSLQGNNLSGYIPPVIGLMQAIAVLDLSGNQLTGPIPPIFGNLTYTEKLYLQGNQLTGCIPSELGNMTSLHYLELNDNRLTGSIPQELGKLTDLFSLNVANNYLEGSIPENMSSCVNLNSLNVHGNRLNGSIPRVFEKLESMTYLNLSLNYLSGHIPVELSRIGNLDTLDISSNKLSGPIPSSIGDLEHLLKLNLSNNNIVGHIPSEFGNLRSIMEIYLSNNQLSGSIPHELGLLQNLNSLKAENNNLTGELVSLSNCFSLMSLNLSYNDFVGSIPTLNNFTRFSSDSFIGNPHLCGYWSDSSCQRSHSQESASMSKVAILGISLGGLVILLMILAAAFKPQRQPQFIQGSFHKPVCSVTPKLVILHMNMALHVYEDIMRMTENLNEKYIIGHGASSTVYKCVLKNCRPVAIKKPYSHPQSVKEFETELETVGSIKHRNLVSLQAYSLAPSGNLLFYDYMENGSLWDILHGSLKKKKNLDWNTRLQIALGAAQGLAYLHHDCSPRIIHRDVKSSNILLDKDFEAHLTDFGIAKCLCVSKAHTSTYVMGSIGYIDPEYARTSRLTEKSDVYSFGIVLLELLTGRKAVENEVNLHHLILAKAAENAVMETVAMEISDTCVDLGTVKKVFQLALLCAKKQPLDRPTMHEVTRVLTCFAQPVSDTKPQKQQSTQPSLPNYFDEYANLNKNNMTCSSSMSTSDGHLFLKFGEVISQNSE